MKNFRIVKAAKIREKKKWIQTLKSIKEKNCLFCNKKIKFSRPISVWRKKKYCSRKCIGISSRRRSIDPSNGYIVYGGQYEHRIIMSRYLGRKIKNSEVIHHINGNKTDNRIINLRITSRAEHCREHKNQLTKARLLSYAR